ncbi:MAG: phytoene desaturase family protein [Prevotella sp.]
MTYDVIIIGSGFGGLVAATLLSQLGERVLVLEQDRQPGGCLQGYQRGDYSFDTGFHYVGDLDEGGGLRRVFDALQLSGLPWQRLNSDGYDHIHMSGREFCLHNGYNEFAEALAEDFPRDKDALKRYSQLLKETEQNQFDCINPSADNNDCALELMGIGAYNYLSENFSDPLLIDVLSAASAQLELWQDSLPLFTMAHVVSGYVRSSWRLKGGGAKLVEQMVNRLRDLGGELQTNSKVVRLHAENGRLTEAELSDGTRYSAKRFISDIHPALTLGLVDQTLLPPYYRRRINRLTNTWGALTVSLVLKPHQLSYFNYNHYVYPTGNVWKHPGVMLSAPVPKEGDELRQLDLITLVNGEDWQQWSQTTVGQRGEEYIKMKEQCASHCIEVAETVVPGLRDMIEQCYISTPLTWRDYTSTPFGSAYGIRKNYRQPLLTMLSTRTTIPNLLLTGQSLNVHGLQGLAVTALETCADIVGKETVWNWLNN